MEKKYEDDDGRTIADMSALESSHSVRLSEIIGRNKKQEEGSIESSYRGADQMSPEDRRMYLFGAMGAALAVGLIFVAAAGLVIGLMVWLW